MFVYCICYLFTDTVGNVFVYRLPQYSIFFLVIIRVVLAWDFCPVVHPINLIVIDINVICLKNSVISLIVIVHAKVEKSINK